MNNIDKQYQQLLQDILDFGVEKKDRTGAGTKSIFGYSIRHNMSEGFPLLTTKKMAWKTMVTELIWFLRGDTNIKFLIDNNCHIWNGDAYKRYHTVMNSDDYIENWVEPGKEREEARKNKGNNGYTKEEFINEIKTDDEFSEMWGLKIEERELSEEEGNEIRDIQYQPDEFRYLDNYRAVYDRFIDSIDNKKYMNV